MSDVLTQQLLQFGSLKSNVGAHLTTHLCIAEERRKREEFRQQRDAAAAATEALLRSTCQTGFDCCIIAAPSNQPIGILRQLLPLLAPSACFALFSNWQQPLAECHMWLQQSKLAVNLQLTESWCRDYQVLPARTHPTMSMSGTGGYLLSGIKLMPA